MKANVFFTLILLGWLLLPAEVALAQGFVKLVGIPGVDPNSLNTEDFVIGLYWLSISVAAFLAVVKIILAGAKYMLTDIVTSKGEAVKDIRAAVFGLIIVLSAVLVLQTISPELVKLNFLRNAPEIDANAQGRINSGVPDCASGQEYRCDPVVSASGPSLPNCSCREIETVVTP